MAVLYETPHRVHPHQHSAHGLCLEDKFEVIKEIGDGSFGSVSLARVRSAGAAIARRGTMVGHLSREICPLVLTFQRNRLL
jgi:meiosis induction protein kinase IME2/SME1